MSQPTIFDYLQRAEQPQTAGTIYDQPIMGPLFKWGGWPQVERTEDPWTRDRKQGRLWEQAHGSPWNAREQLGPIQSKVADFLESPGGSALMMMANFIGPGFKPGMRAPVAAQSSPTEGIRAYHGSPHKFDKFSMDKIGSGEGAQAYGHGLYFAENEGVAKGYRDVLSSGFNGRTDDARSAAARAMEYHKGNKEKAIADLEQNAVGYAPRAPLLREAQRLIEADQWKPGHLYEVNIKAHPDRFLDWDKPFEAQPEAVRNAVGDLVGLSKDIPGKIARIERDLAAGNVPDPFPARMLVKRLREQLNGGGLRALAKTPEGAARLKERGIAGIVYDDAGSRGAAGGPKTRNRVVFDDSIVEILRRYGLAGLMAGLGGAAANQAEAKP